MLPEGWSRRRLGEVIGEMESGVSVNGLDRPAASGEPGVLKISSVTSGLFDPSQNKAIRPDELPRAKATPQADRILVSRCNTAELIGASAYVDVDYPTLFLPDKLWQLEPDTTKPVCMRWLAGWLAADPTRAEISALASGSSGSMKNIGKDNFLDLFVLVPPYEEQKSIAKALETWDRSIRNLRLQMQGLERSKQALMQQVLTGKRRLRTSLD